MDVKRRDPPRTFAAGDAVIRHCADVSLADDEQITFVADSGTEYDVIRKPWGYYATPSVNGRLREKGLRAALVRNAVGKLFVLLAESGREADFEAYLRLARQSLVGWLDSLCDRVPPPPPSRQPNFVERWMLPPGVREWLRRRQIRRRVLTPPSTEESAVLARNAAFRDRCRGRRCFVVGNGPSLNRVDLASLAGETTIVMNSFNCHPVLQQWKPMFYCRAEPPETYDSSERIATIAAFTEGIDAREGYLFPIGSRRIIEQHALLPPDKVYYFKPVVDLTEWPGGDCPLDLTGPAPHAGNTGQLGIMLAIHLGCSPICLVGMDHDWLAHRSVSRHFYAASPTEAGGSDDLGTYSYTEMMETTLREWRRYQALGDLAAQRGCSILNASEGSFLDVFPTVRFDDILAAR